MYYIMHVKSIYQIYVQQQNSKIYIPPSLKKKGKILLILEMFLWSFTIQNSSLCFRGYLYRGFISILRNMSSTMHFLFLPVSACYISEFMYCTHPSMTCSLASPLCVLGHTLCYVLCSSFFCHCRLVVCCTDPTILFTSLQGAACYDYIQFYFLYKQCFCKHFCTRLSMQLSKKVHMPTRGIDVSQLCILHLYKMT